MSDLNPSLLSSQEHRVVAGAIRGLGDKEIAREMGIAFDTVRTYWSRIREKAGGATRSEIVARLVQALAQEQIDAMQREKATLEEEVRRREWAEARLQAILDAMPLGAFFTDAKGRFSYVNRAWAEKMGVPYEEALRFDLEAHMHPDDRQRIAKGFFDAVARREVFRDEHRLIRDDGEMLWLTVRAGPVAHGSQDVAYVGTIENTTERHLQEEAVRRAEAELRSLADLIPEIVMLADGQGVVQFANAWAHTYLGQTLEGMRYGRWVEAVHPDDAGDVRPLVERSKDDAGPTEQTFRLRRASDGLYRWHLLRVRPEHDAEGEIVRWVAVFDDVHDMHAANERLARREAQLQAAQRLAKIGSYTYDYGTGTVEWSDELFSIFGMTPADAPLESEAYMAPVHPEDRERIRQRLARWHASGGEFRDEYRVIAFDGTVKRLAAQATSERTPTGHERVIGVLQDVTEPRPDL